MNHRIILNTNQPDLETTVQKLHLFDQKYILFL